MPRSKADRAGSAMKIVSFAMLALAMLGPGVATVGPGVALSHPAAGVDAVLAEVRQATARYLDVERARADGFVQISGMEPRHGYHFARVDARAAIVTALSGGSLDLARPPMLLYVERQVAWQLAGVEYALPT